MDILMPQLGETVESGTVTRWLKKAGDTIAKGEPLFEVATDKVDTEIPAPADGVLAEIRVPEGDEVAVGVCLAVVRPAGGEPEPVVAKTGKKAEPVPEPAPAAPREPAAKAPRPAPAGGAPLSPVVRRLAAEHGLDLNRIQGTGRDGRVKKIDVERHLAGAEATAAWTPATRPERPAPPKRKLRAMADRVIPFNRIRKLTAEHMVRSKATSPHVVQAMEIDYSAVDRVRNRHRRAWKEREGASLTYLPFIARAVCLAIYAYPRVNASVEGDSLVVHGRVNLGIAVDLDHEGLVVPVIQDAHHRSVAGLARAISDLATRAKGKRLKPGEMQGGTYTLSNSGGYGTLFTTSVISQPQVAILSTDGVQKRPVVIEGEDGDAIAIRPTGVVAQSFDHRAIDGAYSAAFLRELKTILLYHDWEAELR